MKKIKLLTSDLINKIAAGEVVERPASVVKELVENSIDAGATEITVNIARGGIEKIEISDNGTGMDLENAKLSLIQHATSKIYEVEDLAQILSLGFRGEALASIASISDLEIHTYDGQTDPILVTLKDDTPHATISKARNRGTTITVRNIFKNIPARRKFLRSETTEYKNILNTFIDLAIANPQIRFILIKNTKQVYDLMPGDLRKRILSLYPNYNNILDVNYNSKQIKFTGHIGHPNLSRKDLTGQYLFLNGRPIKDRLINKAIKEGYQTSLMHGQHPVYFLNLDIDPALVDVNIHPRKLEVKFFAPGQIFSLVKNTVESTINKSLKQEFSSKVSYQSYVPETTPVINDFNSNTKPISKVAHSKKSDQRMSLPSSLSFTKRLLEPISVENTEYVQKEPTVNDKLEFTKFIQIFDTYIMIERDDKLLIIDQHAADERINFERIKTRIETKNKLDTKPLLLPISFKISPIEEVIILTHKQNIEKLGFKININVKNKVVDIHEVPALIKTRDIENLLKSIIHELEDNQTNDSDIWVKEKEHIIATMACHGSIRAGQKLHHAEIKQLLSDLDKCTLPYSCPHGRPLSWELSKGDLEKQFKRVV